MNLVLQIIQHTPVWVFPLVALVLWLGGLNLRQRTVPLRMLWVLPAVMLVLSIGNAIGTAAAPLSAAATWLIAAAIGAAVGWRLTQTPLAIDLTARRITLPHTVVPLLVCVAIILLRYAFGYLYGRYPDLRADPGHALALVAGSALFGGILLGRSARLGFCYWRAIRAPAANPHSAN